jgi:glucose-specific phosphotransferase system IIA component
MSVHIFASPAQGELISIEKVNDPVFSQRMMGDGFAIIPEGEYFYAPFTGSVEMLFPTGHAIGLKSEDGIEVLIHIGLDTVKLKGEGFKTFVRQGDKVMIGDPLIKVDLELIKKKGYDTTTPIIFLTGQKVSRIHAFQCDALQTDVVTFV